MKTTLAILAAALATALPASAQQLYKYVDKDGRTVYSDTPPVNAASKAIAAPPPPPSGSTASKSAVDRDKELEKTRKEAREKADKTDKTAKAAEDREHACSQAKTSYATFADGGRVYTYNEKGERVFMDDAALAAEKEKSRAAMEEACRKG